MADKYESFDHIIFNAVKQIRVGKQRADNVSIYEFIAKTCATNTTEQFIGERIDTLLEDKKLVNKKTSKGLQSLFLTDISQRPLTSEEPEESEELSAPIPITVETPITAPRIKDVSTAEVEDSLNAQFMALKSFVMNELFYIKNQIDEVKSTTKKSEINGGSDQRLLDALLGEVKYLREENENKNLIIKTLLENQKLIRHDDRKIPSQEIKINLPQEKKLENLNKHFPMENSFIYPKHFCKRNLITDANSNNFLSPNRFENLTQDEDNDVDHRS